MSAHLVIRRWLDELRGAPSPDRLQPVVDRVATPAPATNKAPPRSQYLVEPPITLPAPADDWGTPFDSPIRKQKVGDFEVREYPGARYVVEFFSDCDCRVAIECTSWSAAIYLAGCLNDTAIACDVDVQLDKALS